MRHIPLTRGQVAIVDDQDHERLSHFKWCAQASHGQFYAVHYNHITRTQIRMHRLILYAPRGMEVDHIDGNTLDNRRANLRLATHSQNMQNCKISRANTSGFKGVYFVKERRRWVACIMSHGKRYNLGYFDTPELAAAAYDKAAKLLFRQFAKLNVISGR